MEPTGPSKARRPRAPRGRLARLADALAVRRQFRLRIALVMAAVSLASAYVSYVAAERNSVADGLGALASEQWSEEQQSEQQLDAMIIQDQRLTARIDPHVQIYQDSYAAADGIRATDPRAAAELDLRAQEAYAHFLQFRAFYRADNPDFAAEEHYDVDVARHYQLSQNWRVFRASSDLTREDARQAAELTSSTVLIVLVLVASLLMLTIGHAVGGRRGVGFATAGIVISLAGVVWFAVLDVVTAIPILAGLVVVALGLGLIRIPRVRAWLAGLGQSSSVDAFLAVPAQPDTMLGAAPHDPRTSGFDRFAAIAIAVATLLGAGVGFLNSHASAMSTVAGARAQDLGVEAIGELRADEERIALDIETYEQALAWYVDSWNAQQHASYAAWAGSSAEAQRLSDEADRLEATAVDHEERSGFADELPSTGVSGEGALRAIRAEGVESSARILALQDASSAAARAWSAQAGSLLSVLTSLAVAAYLLGLSLVFRGRRAQVVLAAVGTILLIVSLLRGGATVAGPTLPDEGHVTAAADAYAAGAVAQNAGDPAAAVPHFAEALTHRPDFGIASRELAQAIMETGSPAGMGFRGAFTTSAVDAAIEGLEAARANRADTAGVLLNLGAMYFHRSVDTGSLADMQQSVDYSRRGLALGKDFEQTYGYPHTFQLLGESNLALGLLGLGDIAGAERMYTETAERIATAEPAGFRPYLVSAALAPLERLRSAPLPPSDDVIMRMKEILVMRAYQVGTVDSDAAVGSAQIDLFTSLVQWQATITGFDSERDQLAVQWYRLDPAVGAWSALPLFSGPMVIGGVKQAGSFVSIGDDRYYGTSELVLRDFPPSCVRPGSYRVEFYLNGTLQHTVETESRPANDAFVPQIAPDVGAAMCRPPGFEVSGTPGISTTAVAPDGVNGLAIVKVNGPRSAVYGEAQVNAIERLAATGVPGVPGPLTNGTALDPSTTGTIFNIPAIWRSYDAGDRTVRMGAVVSPSGSVYVACLFGSPAWLVSDEASQLLVSTILY